MHKILLVDDEVVGLEILKDLLESSGYEVEAATSGAEALEKFSEGFDLVVLDIMLPQMDGYEIVRRIRAHPVAGGVPVVMLTALKGEEDRKKAAEAGANDYITKPVDMDDFEERIARLLSQNP